MTFTRHLTRWARAHLQALGASFVFVVFAAAVFWFFASFVPDRREAAIEDWRRKLSLRADHGRDNLDRRILTTTDDLRFVAIFRSVRGLLAPGPSEGPAGTEAAHLQRILSDFRHHAHQKSISILDPSGRVRTSNGDVGPGAASLALAADVIRSGASKVALVREPDGATDLVCAVPVTGDEAGAGRPPVLGAVLAAGDASTLLFDLLRQPVATSSRESLLVREDGTDVLFLSPLRFRPDPPLSFRLPLASAGLAARASLSGKDDFRVFSDYRGARVFAAVRRLESAPWGLVVKVDEDEALAAFRKDMLQKGVTWGALLVALFAAALGFWRSLMISNEVKLARSEANFRNLFEQANDAVFIVGRDGKIRDVNRAAEENYGWSREALVGRHVADLRPEDQRDIARPNFEAADREGRLVFESEHLRADGSRFPVEVSTRLVDTPGDPVHLAIVRDVTARKAAEVRIRALNRLLRTISEVNKCLVRATDEESLLKDVCRILLSHGGYVLAWIGRADRETMRVVPVASAGDHTGYLQRIEVRWDDTPNGRGPLGIAIREGRPAIVSDVQVDPMVAPWRKLHASPGFGSIAAIPIRRGGEVTGGLIVYAAEKAFVDEEELALLDQLAGDLSYALDVLDARALANESELELRNLRRTVEQTHATVLITDLEGRIEYVNPSFTLATGYTAEEVRGQNPRMLKSDRTPPEVYQTLWETILGGRTWSGEICNKRKDGTLFWELASISPVRDEAGVIRHYVAVKEDITERKRAEANIVRLNAELEEALAWQRQIFEGSQDAVFVSDEQARFVAVNHAATELTGYSHEELLAMGIPDLHDEPDLAAYRAFHRRILDGERILSEAPIKKKDGGKVAVEFNNSLVVIGGRRFMHTAGRDVTERKQLESQLVQAQRMEAIGRLAGGVAHDFNNLLTVIQGYGELVRDSLSEDPRHESMDELLKAAGRATSLTRQLLAFSRKQVLEPKIVHLGEIVRETGHMLERLIGEDIALSLVAPGDLATVKADPGQIEQVVLNLAVNARDAMPNGGQLTVSVGSLTMATPLDGFPDQLPAGRWVLMTMEDTGCGMDAETLSHAFEPFFTTKERGKGTGLGLSTVYGIVRQSDGRVQVTSVPGRGTSFQIYLPRSDEKTISGAHPSVGSSLGTETVLVVEDEPAVRNLVRTVLERWGYAVLAAEDGAAALDLVDKHTGVIHVLLTDVVMPGINGRDLAARVRARRPTIKVVFMSGYTADIPTELGTKGGPAFLSKPFNERALTSKLREVLDTLPA